MLCSQHIWIHLHDLIISSTQGRKIPRSTCVGRHFSTPVVLTPIWTGGHKIRLEATEKEMRETAHVHVYSNIKHFIG